MLFISAYNVSTTDVDTVYNCPDQQHWEKNLVKPIINLFNWIL